MTTGSFGLGLRNETDDTLAEWATSRKYRIMNTMFQKKAGRRWTWKSPNGVKKTEIYYVQIHRADATVNIGSGHRLVMSNIKLNVDVERKRIMTTRPPRVDATRIGSQMIEFQLELRNRFETLQEPDNIDTLSETITYMIQQSASMVALRQLTSHRNR